uniref:Nudix hydrolase domain-containing protein n=1 Tax=Steinernema glaseri TaxID=37863 RepID=A0A1I7YIJ6_9BILA
MPNIYVFPGGLLEEQVDRQFPIEKTNYALGFENDYPFRVAALRELFEETGILLVVDETLKKKAILSTLKDRRLSRWREKVFANPLAFQEIFTDYKLDLHSLQPWSNWLTPSSYELRFDTLFFVIPVHKEIEVDLCDKEMSEWLWVEPKDILEKCMKRGSHGVLAPPQFYELNRLLNTRFNRLSAMCVPHKICPQIIYPKEDRTKTYEILPGDHLYDYTDAFHTHSKEMSEADISKSEIMDCVIHRITHFKPYFSRCQLHVKNVDREQEKIRLFHIERTVN